MSFEKDELLMNIKRQSKRLSKKLSCPLGQAQEAMAICVYECGSYSELLIQIRSASFRDPRLVLAALSPGSDLFLFKVLADKLDSILRNFDNKFQDYDINEEMVISLFGLGIEEFKVKISSQ
ncbi:hypothetical protein J3L16_13240 [Alteromonas sp. 5E99-2]|uniref:hypothetical protein n=1 Tax=Alteromonas sp. 5E99-2 TaxID=2817683 RepID=UPI001A99E00B|nr:hypothetical protein [Alteromonas sp. 5E99-2]MBO1256651.1 hypothetical protein [Alteromonas sp. 5E99-2]